MSESGTVVRQIEPNSPWSNRAERYIGIFKQAVRYWCYHREEVARLPFPSQVLGRVLGPSDDIGNEMAVWILQVDGRIISRQTARPLTLDGLNSPLEDARRKAFDIAIKRKLEDAIQLPEEEEESDPWAYLGDVGDGEEIPDTDDDDYDVLVNAEVILPHQDKQHHAVVLGRHRKEDDTMVGRQGENPILNTAVYDVRFPDGAVKQYSANIIAENLYAQVDIDGHTSLVLGAIVDHRTYERALKKEDKFFKTKQRQRKLCQTTKGWKL